MRYLLALVLLVGCGRVNAKDSVNILINMKDANYTATAHALTQLQIQSKNMEIAFGTWDNHQIIVDYARNDQVDNLFRAYVLGVAWIYEEPGTTGDKRYIPLRCKKQPLWHNQAPIRFNAAILFLRFRMALKNCPTSAFLRRQPA